MTKIRTLCFAILTVCWTVPTLTAQQCTHVSVGGVRSIFALAPSPAGSNLLFYGSSEKAEGELVTGNLLKLRLKEGMSDIVRVKAPDASNPPSPVWQPDGLYAYFGNRPGYLSS